ncbi:MAG: hypothetical protein IKX26_04965 [Bacteroidales bacterium]|nr:hypothetical protein [Bacteroidales bacterium]
MENKSVQMPYSEKEEYLDALVSRVTEKAVEEGRTPKKSLRGPLWLAASVAAAAVLLFVFIGRGGEDTEGPIDKYLASLSDEELLQLSSYEIEEWEEADAYQIEY